jgi:nickel-dependent lactate racemase
MRVAIIVSDGTRPIPVSEIPEVPLSCLKDSGISCRKISIVVGLSAYESMDRKPLESLLSNTTSHYKVVQHNARMNNLVVIQISGEERP